MRSESGHQLLGLFQSLFLGQVLQGRFEDSWLLDNSHKAGYIIRESPQNCLLQANVFEVVFVVLFDVVVDYLRPRRLNNTAN